MLIRSCLGFFVFFSLINFIARNEAGQQATTRPLVSRLVVLLVMGNTLPLTERGVVIQSCSVEPLPERDTMRRFDGKSVVESIVRYVCMSSR